MSNIDTLMTDFPVCPFCGEKYQDWWDGQPIRNDGDKWVEHCDRCGGDYSVEIAIKCDFSTEKVKVDTEERSEG
jgi:hydrogenase maturation factor HypF (carbamoyltransferase family)